MAAPCRSILHSCPLQLRNKFNQHLTYSLLQTVHLRTFVKPTSSQKCPASTVNPDVGVDKHVAEALETRHVGVSGNINYRKHPGVMRRTNSALPLRLVKAARILLEKYPVQSMIPKTQKLVKYLFQRQPPLEKAEMTVKAKEVEAKIFDMEGDRLSHLTGHEFEDALAAHKKRVLSRLRRIVYHWKPMHYDAYTAFIYLLGRVASDFAVQLQCFTEISKRDPSFRPTSIFYHGSRVGAGVWASDEIWESIGEHYCVDDCMHMNTIARLLLQDGNEQARVMSIRGVHFRNFAPSPKENKFSIVVCAYNLMEQPSFEERSNLVQDLWELTESYLVLIEVGTGAGFKLVDEAKQILLALSEKVGVEDSLYGHVFAPCPHDKSCPKVRVKKQPCLTECIQKTVDFSKAKMPDAPQTNLRYSYVIMKKGPRPQDTAWPRILQRAKSYRHTHCDLCLPCGDLQHVVISKAKYEKHLYSCARYIQQGDMLPVSLSGSHAEPANVDQADNLDLGSSENVSCTTQESNEVNQANDLDLDNQSLHTQIESLGINEADIIDRDNHTKQDNPGNSAP